MNKDIYRIYYIDYPYPFRFGSYQAILRSLTVKDLVLRLFQDSKLNNQTYERLLRTRQLICSLIFHGIDHESGQKAIKIINRAHSNVVVTNEDYLYVLSTFFLEPFEWDACFGKSQISTEDKQIVVNFWQEIGEAMHLSNFPEDLVAWHVFQEAYEKKYMGFSEAGRDIATQSIVDFSRQAFPVGLHWLGRQVLLATLNPKIGRCLLKLPAPIIPQKLVIYLLEIFKPNFEPKQDIFDQPTPTKNENSPL